MWSVCVFMCVNVCMHMCVYVCVCVWERERERERLVCVCVGMFVCAPPQTSVQRLGECLLGKKNKKRASHLIPSFLPAKGNRSVVVDRNRKNLCSNPHLNIYIQWWPLSSSRFFFCSGRYLFSPCVVICLSPSRICKKLWTFFC